MLKRNVIALLLFLLPGVFGVWGQQQGNISISSAPYVESGLYVSKPIPKEGESIEITVSAKWKQAPNAAADIPARVSVYKGTAKDALETVPEGNAPVFTSDLLLTREGTGDFTASLSWLAEVNGLYTVYAEADPENGVDESDETDNSASLTLPVVVRDKDLHFVWYRVPAFDFRYVTCVTSADDKESERLLHRGILPLRWTYGGMSRRHDAERAEEDPEGVLTEIEEELFLRYTDAGEKTGFGIDECGGYPGTFPLEKSIASMKALIRARRERPDLYYAVWNAGALRPELGEYYRKAADLLLLETYIWGAVPDDLGTEDVYKMIEDRIDPFLRSADMIVPAYGGPCYSLIALDIYANLGAVSPGEQEELIRYIRRVCPEMRGIAWYNGSYTPPDKAARDHYTSLLTNTERLFFDYFIKPCITIHSGGIWLEKGGKKITVALSNIGGIDSGPVLTALYMDGILIGKKRTASVPAGLNRNETRVFVDFDLPFVTGARSFQAVVIDCPGSTVLDGWAALNTYVR